MVRSAKFLFCRVDLKKIISLNKCAEIVFVLLGYCQVRSKFEVFLFVFE